MKRSKQACYDKYFETNWNNMERIHGKESNPLFL